MLLKYNLGAIVMNKKYMAFLIIGIISLTILPGHGSEINLKPIRTDQVNPIKDYVSDAENFYKNYDYEIFEKCPVMQNPPPSLDSEEASEKPVAGDLPAEFNWRTFLGKDWTTPARHQRNCGSCWAFAVIASLESVIKIRENCSEMQIDLSEQYILSCLSSAGSCHGGSGYYALFYMKNTSEKGNYCNGIIPESCFPYGSDDSIPCSEKCLDWEDYLIPILDFGFFRSSGSFDDINAIKTQIMESGPVAAHISATKLFSYWGVTNNNPSDYFPYLGPGGLTNHLICIVGWKDDSSIGNGGYWICKNSWGSYWGYDGFFNIEYGSLHIDDSIILWVDYDPNSVDWPPVANAGKPAGTQIDETLVFTAESSFDPENNIVSYSWDFGDGSTAQGKQVTHSFSQLGAYPVTLTVTDGANQSDTDAITVWIQESNTPPEKPSIYGKNEADKSKRQTYNFTAIDPEGNDLYYYIDWGDGSLEEWIGPFKSGEIISIKHRFENGGIFTIRAKTRDVFNDESPWSTIEVHLSKLKIVQNQPYNIISNFIKESYPNFFKILTRVIELLCQKFFINV
jgi:C1A family cysteine protease